MSANQWVALGLGAVLVAFACFAFLLDRRNASEPDWLEWFDRLPPADRERALAASKEAGEGLDGEAGARAELEALRRWREEYLREKGDKP